MKATVSTNIAYQLTLPSPTVCHCVIVAYAPAFCADVNLDIAAENGVKSRAVKPLVWV